MQINQLLSAKELELAKNPSFADKTLSAIAGMVAGFGASQGLGMMGLPIPSNIAITAGGIYGATRGAKAGAEDIIPVMKARGAKVMGDVGATLPAQSIIQSAPIKATEGILRSREEGRSPQSIQTPAIQQQLYKDIMKNPLPRESSSWIQNQPWIMKKFELLHPEAIPMIGAAFESPEKIKNFMIMWSQTNPAEFSDDKLNRVDGQLTSPQNEELAIKHILDDENLTNTQRALMAQNIRKTKTLKNYNIA
jgi:hypothetical protein